MSLAWPIGRTESKKLDVEFIVNRLKTLRAQKILDLGAGSCHLTKRVADVVGATEVHAIDVQDHHPDRIKEGIHFQLGDLNETIPYQDNYFDLVLSSHNIEHLIDTDKNLEEIYRVLKPGKYCLIETVNLAALHYRLLLLFGFLPNCLVPSKYRISPFKGEHPSRYAHKSVFTYKALIEVVKKHGFILESAQSHTIYPLPTFLGNIICKIWPNIGMFASLLLRKPKL